MFIGESPNYPGDPWQVMANLFPFIGTIVSDVNTYGKAFDEPISLVQLVHMKGDHNGQNVQMQPCFSRNLG